MTVNVAPLLAMIPTAGATVASGVYAAKQSAKAIREERLNRNLSPEQFGGAEKESKA